MHPEFRRWSRQTTVEPDEQRLAAQWSGVEQLAATWKKRHAQDLALALALVQRFLGDQTAVERTQAFLRPLKDRGIYEIRLVLAGFLLKLLEDRGNGILGVAVAYALGCASFFAADERPMLQLLMYARNRLSDDAVHVRRRQALALPSIPIPKQIALADKIAFRAHSFFLHDYDGRRTEKIPIPDEESTNAFVAGIVQSNTNANKYLADVGVVLTRYAQEIHAAQRMPDERIDLLTWEHGGYSLSLRRPLAELSLAERVLPAARELAEQTQILPGPYAAPALLHQFLGSPAAAERISIADALQAHPAEWRTALVPAHAYPRLCPVLGLLTDLAEERSPPGEMLTMAVHPTKLALQIYEELLLGRLIQEGKA